MPAWRRAVPAAAAMSTLVLALPGTAAGSPSPPPAAPAPLAGADSAGQSSSYTDPFSTLGARSPFCSQDVGARAERYCQRSGSVAHPYPISSYGIDSQVHPSATNITDYLSAAVQGAVAAVWLVLVYLVKGVLLLLEWAFSLDVLNRGMAGVRHALDVLHTTVLGRPWFLFAIATAGVWGIWRGFVQRRATETLSGLALTAILMLVALALISDPDATVGRASQLADQGSLSLVSATRGGNLNAPAATFAAALKSVFDETVLQPWAALEFGDVNWATRPARPGSAVTNADLWLAFPAGSRQRAALYSLQKGQSNTSGGGLLSSIVRIGGLLPAFGGGGGQPQLPKSISSYVRKDPSKVRIQESGGTYPRLALLALIGAGVSGAIALFLYVGVRLVLASIMSLLLLLLAPAMLLAPAFGDSGRATARAWMKRLAAALTAKLVYSLLLAVVLVGQSVITALRVGWFATWLVMAAYWWGVLLKRHELVGFVSAGHVPPPPAGHARVLLARQGMRLFGAAVAGSIAGSALLLRGRRHDQRPQFDAGIALLPKLTPGQRRALPPSRPEAGRRQAPVPGASVAREDAPGRAQRARPKPARAERQPVSAAAIEAGARAGPPPRRAPAGRASAVPPRPEASPQAPGQTPPAESAPASQRAARRSAGPPVDEAVVGRARRSHGGSAPVPLAGQPPRPQAPSVRRAPALRAVDDVAAPTTDRRESAGGSSTIDHRDHLERARARRGPNRGS